MNLQSDQKFIIRKFSCKTIFIFLKGFAKMFYDNFVPNSIAKMYHYSARSTPLAGIGLLHHVGGGLKPISPHMAHAPLHKIRCRENVR